MLCTLLEKHTFNLNTYSTSTYIQIQYLYSYQLIYVRASRAPPTRFRARSTASKWSARARRARRTPPAFYVSSHIYYIFCRACEAWEKVDKITRERITICIELVDGWLAGGGRRGGVKRMCVCVCSDCGALVWLFLSVCVSA